MFTVFNWGYVVAVVIYSNFIIKCQDQVYLTVLFFQLFRQVRVTWADVEKAEREKQKKLGAKDPQEQRNSLNEENTTNKEVVESRSVDKITNITNIKVENETQDLEPSGELLVEKTTLVQNDVEVLEPNIQNSENKEEDEIRGNKSFSRAELQPHEERTLNDQETSVH